MNTDKKGVSGKGQGASVRSQLSLFMRLCLWFTSLLLAPVARAENHEFILDTSGLTAAPKSVHLAGDFNGWSKVATPMSESGNGVFKISIPLAEGVHYYKFVLDGEKWIT